jgi:para-nitrobenzyl esterase
LRLSDPARADGFANDGGDPNSSNEALARLLIADGKAPDRAAAKARILAMSEREAASYLRAKSAADVLAAYKSERGMGMIELPRVFSDGAVIAAGDPLQLLANKETYNAVPVMVGTNRDENKLFMSSDPARVRLLFWLLPRVRDEQRYNVSAEYLSRMWKAASADEPASAMSRANSPGVYVYRFDWDEEPSLLGSDLPMLVGAAHAFEIPFVFGHFDLGKRGNVIFTKENEPGRKNLSRRMMGYWAEFARHGAPGRGGIANATEWVGWNADNPQFLLLDTPAGGGVQLASGALSPPDVLAAVDTDPRLPSQRDKCAVYRELADWGLGVTRAQYASASKETCKQYPFDQYPWG